MVITAAVLAACSGESASTSTTSTAHARSTTTTKVAFTGDAASPFCALLARVDPSVLLTGDSTDPAAVKRAFEALVTIVREAHALAPSEIEPDLALVRAGIEALDTAVRAAGYDFHALATSGRSALVTQALSDPVFTSAGERLGDYRKQVCNL